MKLSIQYTEADFREANAQAVIRPKRKMDVIDVAIFLVMVAAFNITFTVTDLFGSLIRTQRTSAYDLVLLLGPGILASVLFLAMMVHGLLNQLKRARRRAPFADPQASASRSRVGRIVATLVVLAMIAVFAIMDRVPQMQWWTTRRVAFLVGLVPFFVMLIALVIIVSIHKQKMMSASWQQQANLHRPRTLEFSDEQVISTDALTTVSWNWAALVRFRETKNLFLIVLEDSRFLIVPKRNLSDPTMMIEFRALLQTHIAEGYFLTVPAGAFPVVNAVTLPPPPLASR